MHGTYIFVLFKTFKIRDSAFWQDKKILKNGILSFLSGLLDPTMHIKGQLVDYFRNFAFPADERGSPITSCCGTMSTIRKLMYVFGEDW